MVRVIKYLNTVRRDVSKKIIYLINYSIWACLDFLPFSPFFAVRHIDIYNLFLALTSIVKI